MTKWWQKAVIYQIYPRSFQDTDGDGVGDLQGIEERLDYLSWLGIDAIWISPFYPSPMADFGYDVADYCNVDPLFGTLRDFDHMMRAAKARGLKVILDFVPNHTSSEHPWFKESRSSRSNPKRDWYIWRDPAPGGGPPNNWLSDFGGSGWEFDAATGQYYYHGFLSSQPDLNWRNPEVAEAMHKALRFWLDRGVDGFRFDVVWQLVKDGLFRDNPPDPDYRPSMGAPSRQLQIYSTDRLEVHGVLAGLKRVLGAYPGERVFIGELYLPIDKLVTYYGKALEEADLPFNFHLMQTPWRADAIADLIRRYEAALPRGAWPNWVLANHDRPRIASRVGEAQARVAAVLLLTLRGTPTLYYGDEIGLPNVAIPPERVRDPIERTMPGQGRDPVRTPMQWDDGPNAGFTAGTPWLPLSEDWRTRNVEMLAGESASLLSLYRDLLRLRGHETALSLGAIAHVSAEGDVLRYVRQYGGERCLVLLNFSAMPRQQSLPGDARLLLSTARSRAGDAHSQRFDLKGNEAAIFALPAL